MENKVDLHIHTNYSDGHCTPTEVVKRAKEQGYDIIAITDHDGIGGVGEAKIAGEALDIKVVPGVELSTEIEVVPNVTCAENTTGILATPRSENTTNVIGLHILGYYIDIKYPPLQEALEDLQKKRNDRNEKLLAALDRLGFPVEMPTDSGFVGKPNIAREMVKKGYIKHPKEAFTDSRFFASEEIRAIKKERLKTQSAITLIKEAGGIAVLAHPIQIRGLGEPGSEPFFEQLDALIKNLKAVGLKGLECYYPEHSHEQALRFVEIAEKYHLHITKGSDFHGEDFE